VTRIPILLLLCSQVLLVSAAAGESVDQPNQPASQDKLATDIEVVAQRLRATIHKPWQIEIGEREIFITYPKQVGYTDWYANGPAINPEEPTINSEEEKQRQKAEAAKTLHQKECRFTLRFDDKLSLTDYQRISLDKEKQRDQLRASVGRIPHKFDDYLPRDESDRELLIAYRRGMAKLNEQVLPDLYTSEHSIHLTRSWSDWELIGEERIIQQVVLLEETLARQFGVYDTLAVAKRRSPSVGKYAPVAGSDYRVATVLGKDIYRCEIVPTHEWRTQREEHLEKHGEASGFETVDGHRKRRLRSLVWKPLVDRFREEHKQEVEVTDADVEEFLKHHRRAIAKQKLPETKQRPAKTPEQEEFFARWYLGNWKLQKAFYEKYGGRVIFQQVGPEAINGMRDFLREQEQQGRLKFHQERLAKIFWEPFIREKPGVVLPNPDQIFSGDWASFYASGEHDH